MRIIQSYWSKPSRLKKQTGQIDIYDRYNGGFPSVELYLMSLTLSCLKLRQHYQEVELITDEEGYELLITGLGLPYTKVAVCLDRFNDYPAELWSIPKIYTFSLQTTPFIHVDGDVFIWQKFNCHWEKAGLLAQNLDKDNGLYSEAIDYTRQNLLGLPESIQHYIDNIGENCAINAGVIGGNDISFIQQFSTEVLDLYEKNYDRLFKEGVGKVNIVLEQFLFYKMALQQHKTISCLFDYVGLEYVELTRFNLVPNMASYIHLMGKAKLNPYAHRSLELHLRSEFEEYYQRVNNLVRKKYAQLVCPRPEEAIYQSLPVSDEPFQRTSSLLDRNGYRVDSSEQAAIIVKDFLETVADEKRKIFIAETFELETTLFLLNNRCDNGYSEDDRFEHFCSVKRFIAGVSREEVMQQKYQLVQHMKILVLENDINALLTGNYEATDNCNEELIYVYLLKKRAPNVIEYKTLKGIEELLYYFGVGALSGHEFAEILKERDDRVFSEAIMNSITFNVITGALVYDQYLTPMDVGS